MQETVCDRRGLKLGGVKVPEEGGKKREKRSFAKMKNAQRKKKDVWKGSSE